MKQSDNPYLTPGAELTPGASVKRHYGLASPAQRFGNYVIDHIASAVLVGIVGGVWGLLAPESVTVFDDKLYGYGISIAVTIAYYSLLEGLTGRTLGKLVTSTEVIAVGGGKPGLRALGRSLARYIPFEAFTFISGDKPGLHDSLSKTVVVRLRPSDLQRAMAEV